MNKEKLTLLLEDLKSTTYNQESRTIKLFIEVLEALLDASND